MNNDGVRELQTKIDIVTRELASTERRVARLEKGPGRYSRFLMALGFAAIAALMLGGAASPVRERYGAALSRVRAPFRIVDGQRKTVLFVKEEGDGSPRGVYLFGSTGKPAVSMRDEAANGGGVIAALDVNTPRTYAIMGALNGGLGMKMKIEGQTMVYAGGDDGESMVKIYGPRDKAVAGIVANKAGSGEVAVYGEGGTVLAALAEGRTPHTGAAIAADVTGAEAFRVIAGPDGGSACVNRHGNYACIGPTVSFGR